MKLCGNFRKQVTKPFPQTAAPDCTRWNNSKQLFFFQIMLSSLGDGTNTKKEGKIVVLAHDQEFGADLKGGNVDMAVALDRFIKLAKEAGFVFRKLATYPYDN